MTLQVFSAVGFVQLLAFYASLCGAQCTPHNSLTFLSPVTAAPGLTATPIFANLTTPRGVAFDSHQNLLVVERGIGVTAFTDKQPGCNGWFRSVVVQNANFTQGIQLDSDDSDTGGGSLYVSTSGEVFRYPYDAINRQVRGEPQVIVSGIPPDGGT